MCTNKKVVCQARIVENSAIAPDTFSLVLEAPELVKLVKPGQFIELNLRQPDLVLPRPISVYSVTPSLMSRPGRSETALRHLEVRYQIMGEGTRRLASMPAGTELGIFGPLGNTWPIPEGAQRALLIGGGIGSAPLAMLATQLAEQNVAVTMVQGGRNAELLIACDHFEDVCDHHVIATDDGSRGHKGFVTAPLKLLLDDDSLHYDLAYVCGPEPMQEACFALTAEAGIATYVSLERMMACGVGACLTCVVPTADGLKRVCADGPIFNAEDVNWSEARSARVH